MSKHLIQALPCMHHQAFNWYWKVYTKRTHLTSISLYDGIKAKKNMPQNSLPQSILGRPETYRCQGKM